MREAQDADFERAGQYGLQMMSKGAGAEAAETLKIRVAARTADLVSVAHTSAAGLEQADLEHWVLEPRRGRQKVAAGVKAALGDDHRGGREGGAIDAHPAPAAAEHE